ncbi:MAG: hypothetical protein HC892_06590 [Saprospiraceae bacterium]|nr:hypothetical protein [Saprospiraceae bacterium]
MRLFLLLSIGVPNFAMSQQVESSTTNTNLGVQITLDLKALRGELMEAALEKKTSRITLPLQNGESMDFEVIESPVMEQGLADQFPEIKSFLIQGIAQPTWKGRIAISPFGLVAVVLTEEGTMVIEPTERYSNPNKHRVYWNHELAALRQEVSCGVNSQKQSFSPLMT